MPPNAKGIQKKQATKGSLLFALNFKLGNGCLKLFSQFGQALART